MSKTVFRRPTKIMQQAVNLEFEGKSAEALRHLEEHASESKMHTSEWLSHFLELRRAKDLGPYRLDNSVRRHSNGTQGSTREASKARVPQLTNPTLEMINEATPTTTLLQLQGKIQRLLSMRNKNEVDNARHKLGKVARLRQELEAALSALDNN